MLQNLGNTSWRCSGATHRRWNAAVAHLSISHQFATAPPSELSLQLFFVLSLATWLPYSTATPDVSCYYAILSVRLTPVWMFTLCLGNTYCIEFFLPIFLDYIFFSVLHDFGVCCALSIRAKPRTAKSSSLVLIELQKLSWADYETINPGYLRLTDCCIQNNRFC